MSEVQKEENKKTIVSFVVGLLIGGILVWAFTGSENVEAPAVQDQDDAEIDSSEEDEDVNDEEGASEPSDVNSSNDQTNNLLPVGEGSVVVEDQSASTRIALASASYPVSEGWIGVRDYTNGNLGGILGVVRFSESQGLVPKDIILQRATRSGNEYAVVIFTEDGDRIFNSATDAQLPTIFATFKAQ